VKHAGHDFEKVGNASVSPALKIIHQKSIDFFKHGLSLPDLREPGIK
jgi:hypothetical protein